MNREQYLKKARRHLLKEPVEQAADICTACDEEAAQERREDRVDEKREREQEFDFERDQGARP